MCASKVICSLECRLFCASTGRQLEARLCGYGLQLALSHVDNVFIHTRNNTFTVFVGESSFHILHRTRKRASQAKHNCNWFHANKQESFILSFFSFGFKIQTRLKRMGTKQIRKDLISTFHMTAGKIFIAVVCVHFKLSSKRLTCRCQRTNFTPPTAWFSRSPYLVRVYF